MALLSRKEIAALVKKEDKTCVSLFMSTHQAGREIRQDPIRLKNLIRKAEEFLRQGHVPSREMKSLLAPAAKFLDDALFWRYQSSGLAVFCAPGFFSHYRLPLAFDEMIVVTNHFHIKPLMPLMTGDGRFYILAISQNHVRLLECSRDICQELTLEGVPASLKEALKYDQLEKQFRFHTVGPGTAIFHGQGEGKDTSKDDILRFFQQVDSGLIRLIGKGQAPLVLAAVDYLHPIYEEASAYPFMLKSGIRGNPEGMTGDELHRQAWEIVKPYFTAAREKARKRYGDLKGTGLSSRELDEIIPAAYQGRIEVLFVTAKAQCRGIFNRDIKKVEIHPDMKVGDEDLLNLAAIYTFVHNGTVYVVPPEGMPDTAEAVGVLRY